ncbi:hypothetical protein [Actimicrobium antarcticum]|uniref:Uncharacterized protein n=1 Tax=Actimicrobium antarcticum TaxID=1051899 RepID=A0ABP7TIN6_9BURK
MKSRKIIFVLSFAFLCAVLIAHYMMARPYEEQLMRIQTSERLGNLGSAVLDEPMGIQAILLDYSSDQALLLKTWIALKKYPTITRELLMLYGEEPIFKRVMKNYGESVVPVIQYFRANEIWTYTAQTKIAAVATDAASTLKQAWSMLPGTTKPAVPRPAAPPTAPAAPAAPAPIAPPRIAANERGWYAVNILDTEGHDLLGQFVEGQDGQIRRIQTDRFGKLVIGFLSSGIRNIETKSQSGDELKAADYLWAGVDVLPFIGIAKGLRLVKQASVAGKEIRISTKTRLLAPKLFESTAMLKLAKYGSGVAAAYLIVTHPSLVNSLLGQAAKFFGIDPWLFQLGGWWLILSLLLFPFIGLIKLAARLLLAVFSLLEKSRPKKVSVPVAAMASGSTQLT